MLEEFPTRDPDLFGYLENCIRHRSEMVSYEAVRALCNLSNVTAKDLTGAVGVLNLFLNSPRPTTRFVAVSTLNKVLFFKKQFFIPRYQKLTLLLYLELLFSS